MDGNTVIYIPNPNRRQVPFEPSKIIASLNCLLVQIHRQPDPSVKRPVDPRAPPLKLKDLECVRSLGQSNLETPKHILISLLAGKGVYGRVLLVRTRRNIHPMDKPGLMYAMKVLRKKYIRMDEAVSPCRFC